MYDESGEFGVRMGPKHGGVNSQTISEDPNPLEIIFDYGQRQSLSRMMTWYFFSVRRDWKSESIQMRIEQGKFGRRPTMTGILNN